MQKTIKENIMPINTPKIKIKVDTGNLKKALDMTSELKGELGNLRIPVQVIRIGHPEDIVAEKIKTIEDVKWNLIARAEKALEKELENNNAMSSERVNALTRLIEVLIRK